MPTIQIHDRRYPNIRALVFDKDGTLAQSHDYLYQQAYLRWEALERALNQKSADRNLPFLNPMEFQHLNDRLFQAWGLRNDEQGREQVHPAGLLAVGSRRDNELVTAGYLTPLGLAWIEALTLVHDAFLETKLQNHSKAEQTPPIPDLAQHLARFQAAGLKLAILSADTEANLHSFVHTWEIQTYIETWVGAQPGLTKPDPKLLEMTCEQLQVKPEEVLVIGDSSADMELAKRGNAAAAIGFSYGWSFPVQLPQADQHLHSIAELEILSAHPHS